MVWTFSPKAKEKSLEGFKQRSDLIIFSFRKTTLAAVWILSE